MTQEALTVVEAVPLGTVHLQRLLTTAGIRCLAIKGPAFVELGVRAPRHSNDIDLLVPHDDRTRATETLAAAGWSIISHWFPPALDDVIYSTTFHHELFPVTLDLHHRFSGLLAGERAFDELWESRREVSIAHQPVVTVGREHALIIEALNATKLLDEERRGPAAAAVAAAVEGFAADEVVAAAEAVGARHTAAPLIEALGGEAPTSTPPPAYRRWVRRGGRNSSRDLVVDLVRRAPGHIPRVVREQLLLDEAVARLWARAHRVPYRGRWQVLGLRIKRLVMGERSRFRR